MTAPITAQWVGTAVARTSIVHGGRMLGTTRLLRRETIVDPAGGRHEIPVVSGNALRAMLRHRAEELMAEVLQYERQIPFAAAVMLRGGGRLARTTREPLSGQRLLRLCELVPVLSVFGGSSATGTVAGCLQVGKLTPHLKETAHLFPHADPDHLQPAVAATQQESYTRADHESTRNVMQTAHIDSDTDYPDGGSQMVFQLETFPAGTRFGTWLTLERATTTDHTFLADVLADIAATGLTVGGRSAIGHGQLALDLDHQVLRGTTTPIDWRTHLTDHRDEVLELLQAIA